MTMYSAAVTHSHCEDCGQATMRLEYEKSAWPGCALLLPCYSVPWHWGCYHIPSSSTCFLQGKPWVDPSIICLFPPSSEFAHVCVSPHGSSHLTDYL
jgi:hypothetical protein